ncbi:hypothetical protein Sez_1781 [Streptococcus equi subsp. zooepidemicus MGCS10565]|uniref:Uncharacterized protein n=1 Tax=Streptococcus equi subsp. zooepidemicus (strain MGCS10565) TaxID=552526 RepID=B4U597_STREM|nr:hypothetical protein Sez_1781 [Streptococcus equi subsp. zooepidemicus MGCS10565]
MTSTGSYKKSQQGLTGCWYCKKQIVILALRSKLIARLLRAFFAFKCHE